jgi:hypothetical protein
MRLYAKSPRIDVWFGDSNIGATPTAYQPVLKKAITQIPPISHVTCLLLRTTVELQRTAKLSRTGLLPEVSADRGRRFLSKLLTQTGDRRQGHHRFRAGALPPRGASDQIRLGSEAMSRSVWKRRRNIATKSPGWAVLHSTTDR